MHKLLPVTVRAGKKAYSIDMQYHHIKLKAKPSYDFQPWKLVKIRALGYNAAAYILVDWHYGSCLEHFGDEER